MSSASEATESLSLEERVAEAERLIFVQYQQISDLSKAVNELRIELVSVRNSVDHSVMHVDHYFEEHRSWLMWLTTRVEWLCWKADE